MTKDSLAPAPKGAGFKADVRAGLGEEPLAALRRLRFLDRLTSLWTPVTIFGIAFAVYVAIVEVSTCTYYWLQPALKGFGLLMLAAFVVLAGMRLFWQRFSSLRRLRHEGAELEKEVAGVIDRNRSELSARSYDELLAQARAVSAAAAATEPQTLQDEIEKLNAAADKQLARWRKHSMFDFVGGLVAAFAVALLIRAVIIEPFKIPSGSMIPTLEIGDQIFVNKFIYGVRIPFLNVVPFVIFREPARGDVVVFDNPYTGQDFVKRVIGVPGDQIEIKDKELFINGERQTATVEAEDYSYADQGQNGGVWWSQEATLFREEIGGQVHRALRRHGSPVGYYQGPYTVPPENVFVMGDNRDNSNDSREGLGGQEKTVKYVPFKHIKGKAMVIWLSLSYGGLFQQLFGGTGLRTDRLFQSVRMCGTEPPQTTVPVP